ncbi:MAG: PEP-CTERM sorting domain-containing protein [Phycisphaeraceae bacterium]|nr:MAG: PEP-CTERM sorting domain-containing protein [Phycisphaeraceae bacterium]
MTANINANAAFGFTGTTDATLIVSNLGATGNITLIYNYIPAPGTMALMGLAGLAATRRRR